MNKYIMFTDMVGYSKLTGDDQNLALELLKEHDKIIEPIIKINKGSIVKRIGDAIVAIFDHSSNIIDSAVEIQRALKKRNISNTKSRQIVIRIGLHYGEITLKNDEVYGLGYDIASSIEPVAEFAGIAFSQELYDTSHHNNELVINGSDNQFFVRPVAEFTFKVCPDEVMVYKLYLSLLDWYDESHVQASIYLQKQNIKKQIYKIKNFDLDIKLNTDHKKLALHYLDDHNLSLSIYHFKMFKDQNQKKSLEIEFQIINIFCNIGLTRMVERLCKDLDQSYFVDYINGLNYFNAKDLTNSQIKFENVLEQKNVTSYFIDSILYLLIIYFKNQDYQKGVDLLSFHEKIFKNHILKNQINHIKKIFEDFKNNLFNDQIMIDNDFSNIEVNTRSKNYLFLFWFYIQYNQKLNKTEDALIYQNYSRELINNLTNKISGHQLKETFNQSPFLHQMLMEDIDIVFNSNDLSDDLVDIDIDLNTDENIFKFCFECGFNNSKSFKFCPSCGNKLTK